MDNIIDLIRARRSVRTFSGTPLSDDDRQKLEQCANDSCNPFGVPVEFRFLGANENNLSSPVIVGCDFYAAAKVSRAPQFEIAYGYSFEKFCLGALSLGLGTVILAGTLSRKTFEKAMELKENELMPAATPVGYFSDKKSIREKLMRKAIKADGRLPFEKLFFKNSFDKSLTPVEAGRLKDALEMVRLAPSAVNKQPWRAVVCDDVVHFFESKSKGYDKESLDLQKIDIGIALCHFDLTAKECGICGAYFEKKPDFKTEDGIEYIISFKIQ